MPVAPALLLCKGSEVLRLESNCHIWESMLLHCHAEGSERMKTDANNPGYVKHFLVESQQVM